MVQDVDYENELELLYAVVTHSGCNELVETKLHFIDDKTGSSTKIIPLPQWNDVSILGFYNPISHNFVVHCAYNVWITVHPSDLVYQIRIFL